MPIIKMLTTMAGPAGCHNAGEIWDAPPEVAEALIQGNFAVPATSEVSKMSEIEVARTMKLPAAEELLEKQNEGTVNTPKDFKREEDLVPTGKKGK